MQKFPACSQATYNVAFLMSKIEHNLTKSRGSVASRGFSSISYNLHKPTLPGLAKNNYATRFLVLSYEFGVTKRYKKYFT